MPQNEGLIPALQRRVRTAVANAGDTTGNLISSQGRSVQALGRNTSHRVQLARPSTSSSPPAARTTTTTKSNSPTKKPSKSTTSSRPTTTTRTTKPAAPHPIRTKLFTTNNNKPVLNNAQKTFTRTVNNTTRQVNNASTKYIDGTGRQLGGAICDWGNTVKDWTGARGPRESTVMNPLGLQGKRAL